MSLSVRILETPPAHLEHRFSGFIFANFMELIKLREQDDQDATRGIQTRAIRQRLENKSKGQLMLEDFRYWALKYVMEFLCHIEFNLTEGICYYERGIESDALDLYVNSDAGLNFVFQYRTLDKYHEHVRNFLELISRGLSPILENSKKRPNS